MKKMIDNKGVGKKYYNIRTLITGWGLFFSVLLAIIIVIAVQISTTAAIDTEIEKSTYTELKRHEQQVEWADNIPYIRDNMDEETGIYHIIIDESYHIIDGELPSKLSVDELPNEPRMVDVYSHGNHFCIRRIRLHRYGRKDEAVSDDVSNNDLSNNSKYYLYIIINYNKVDTVYHSIRRITIFTVFAVLLLMIFTLLFMSNRLTRRLKNVTDQAADITRTGDYSQSLEVTTSFREVSVLVDTCNHLLSRVNHTIIMQKQFNHDVSHELRTPVTVLKAQCQLAKKQFTDEESRAILDVVERQTNRMNTLIHLLLDLSRIEQGRIYTDTEEVNLTEIVQSVCDDIALIYGIDEDVFEISLSNISFIANTELILTMMKNLIENSVKYSPDSPHIEIRGYEESDGIYICIKDNGVGMSETEIEHIFDSFYRADSARNTDGFGLGLTLADRIAKLYHGRIDIESVIGEGSLFTVYIPI